MLKNKSEKSSVSIEMTADYNIQKFRYTEFIGLTTLYKMSEFVKL